MSEVKVESMADFMDQIDESMRSLNLGDIISGSVISVNNDELLVGINFRADGIVKKEEISEQDALVDLFRVGDKIDVQVVKMNDGDGNVVLSKKRADSIVVWEEIEECFKNNSTIFVKINEAVKGGLVSIIKGVRAFLPASQVSLEYVEDLSVYIGKSFDVNIIEFDRDKNKVVLSRKQILKDELERAKKGAFESLKQGMTISGEVKRLAKFGAFVDIGGVDGLVHISEMSWRRVKDPSEILKVGDKVEVEITKIDKQNEKISLRLTNIEQNPWDTIHDKYEENEIVDGEVVRLTDFGAFVKLEEHIEGLLHVSQISDEKIDKPSDVLTLGQMVEVLITKIDDVNQKISLSIKQIEDEEIVEQVIEEDENTTIGDLFGDKLKNLL